MTTSELILRGVMFQHLSEDKWGIKCPSCNSDRWFVSKKKAREAMSENTKCRSCSKVGSNHPYFGKDGARKGHVFPATARKRMSISAKADRVLRNTNVEYLKKLSEATTNAWNDPIKRKAMVNTCRWNNEIVDKGFPDFIKKWESLGFHFDTNYQVKQDEFLAYVDAYDKEHGVVLEYDSKYHLSSTQQQKDFVRQNKIIDILNPNKFWRYDAVNKQCKNVLGG